MLADAVLRPTVAGCDAQRKIGKRPPEHWPNDTAAELLQIQLLERDPQPETNSTAAVDALLGESLQFLPEVLIGSDVGN